MQVTIFEVNSLGVPSLNTVFYSWIVAPIQLNFGNDERSKIPLSSFCVLV